jgi:hypothetical protein
MMGLRVEHYLTKDDLVDILASQTQIETGAAVSDRKLLQLVADGLRSAIIMEPYKDWADSFYSDEEAEVRFKWAADLVDAFYERTRY